MIGRTFTRYPLAEMNWHKEGIGAAIAEAKSKGEIFAVFVKSISIQRTPNTIRPDLYCRSSRSYARGDSGS